MAGRAARPAIGGARAPGMRQITPELLGALSAEAEAAAKRGATTRARLVQAAAEVIERRGYGGASVAAIAERAGMATGALYRHFPSKADLFVELFRHAAHHQLDMKRAAAAQHTTFIDKLDAVLTSYAANALANRRLTWALVYEPVDALVDAERLACRRRYCENMATLVEGAIAGGEIPDQNAYVTAAAIVGALAEALVGPLSPVATRRVDEAALVSGILDFCRRAVGAPGT